jgi:hypothetical protein
MSRRASSTDGGAWPGDTASASSDRRVRFTLDLARPQHRFLKQFALDLEADASTVMRILLRLLEEDEALAERVATRTRKARTESVGR